MTEFEKDLQQEELYPEMRKGFKGFWWNFFNCGKLSKEDRKTVVKKTMIAGLIALVAIIALILGICLALAGISTAIENATPYSQVSVETFRKNWNEAAKADPNGVTEGISITKKETKDGYNIISLTMGELSISRTGSDIDTLAYTSPNYNEKNHTELIQKILAFCLLNDQDSDIVAAYIEQEKAWVQSELSGFKICFSEAETAADISFEIEPMYQYTNNIIAADLLTGCAFNITLDDFIETFNNLATNHWGETIAPVWKISTVSFDTTENVGNRSTTRYKYFWDSTGSHLATVYITIDDASKKISSMEYQTLTDLEDEEAIQTLYKDLPDLLLVSLGFSAEGYGSSYIYDNYFGRVEAENDYSVYERGVWAKAKKITEKDGNSRNLMYMIACTEDHANKILNGGYSDQEIADFAATAPNQPKEESQNDAPKEDTPAEDAQESSNTPEEHAFMVKTWSGSASDDTMLTIDVKEFDASFKIKGTLTVTNTETQQEYGKDLDLLPDGEGNYYIQVAADQDYEIWFYIQDEQNLSCSFQWEDGGSASFFLN